MIGEKLKEGIGREVNRMKLTDLISVDYEMMSIMRDYDAVSKEAIAVLEGSGTASTGRKLMAHIGSIRLIYYRDYVDVGHSVWTDNADHDDFFTRVPGAKFCLIHDEEGASDEYTITPDDAAEIHSLLLPVRFERERIAVKHKGEWTDDGDPLDNLLADVSADWIVS